MIQPWKNTASFQMSFFFVGGEGACPFPPVKKPEFSSKDVQNVFRQADIAGEDGNPDGQLSKKELKRYVKLKEAELMTLELKGQGGDPQKAREIQKELKIAKGLLRNFDEYAGKAGNKRTINSEEAHAFFKDQGRQTMPPLFGGEDTPFGGRGILGNPSSLWGDEGKDPIGGYPPIGGGGSNPDAGTLSAPSDGGSEENVF